MLALRLGADASAKARQQALAVQIPGINGQIFALMAHDSVWALAHAMHAHQLAGGDPGFADGGRLIGRLASGSSPSAVNFSGVTGRVVFDSNLERSNIRYELITFVPGATTVASVGHWKPGQAVDSGQDTLILSSEFEARSRQSRVRDLTLRILNTKSLPESRR